MRWRKVQSRRMVKRKCMIKISQKDRRWGEEKIGQSSLKIKDYGCLITSISMFSNWYCNTHYPHQLAEDLLFTKDGLLLWKSIDSSDLPMKFVYRYYYKDDKKIKEILKSNNSVCILQVNGNHWVCLVGYSPIFGYKINDPYYGDTIYLKKRNYIITGFAELTRK